MDSKRKNAAPSAESTLARNIWFNNANGVAFTLSFNLFNPFLGIFALKLGAPDSYIALLSSLPALTSVLSMVPGARFIDRFERKKGVTAWILGVSRFFYLLLALVPFLAPHHAALALVLLVGIMNIPASIAGVAWQSFIAGVIPPTQRNQVFAQRNLIMSAAGLIPLISAGPLIDWLGAPRGYQAALGLAGLIAVAEVALFLGIRETPPAGLIVPADGQPVREALSPTALRLRLLGTLQRYPIYWRFCTAAFFFHIAWMMSWPLFTIYNVNVLGANNTWIAAINILNTLAAIATFRFWGRLADRIGTLPAMALSGLGLAGFPLLVAMTHSLLVVTVFNAYVGAFGGAVGFLLLNALLEVVPEQNRTGYIAVYNTMINVAATIAPLIGVGLLGFMSINASFVLSGVLRAFGALAFWLVYRWARSHQQSLPGRAGLTA
ncbi:MAG: MFS transporter [Symbiobacteriia bacterium]